MTNPEKQNNPEKSTRSRANSEEARSSQWCTVCRPPCLALLPPPVFETLLLTLPSPPPFPSATNTANRAMRFSLPATVLVAASVILSLLPTLDAQGACPLVSINAPRTSKAGRQVRLVARSPTGAAPPSPTPASTSPFPRGWNLWEPPRFPSSAGILCGWRRQGRSCSGLALASPLASPSRSMSRRASRLVPR